MAATKSFGDRAMLASASWASRIMSMLASTSLARKRLTSAPALKNFSLALRSRTTRAVGSSLASAIADASPRMNSMS